MKKSKFIQVSHSPKNDSHSNAGRSESFVLKRVSDNALFKLSVYHESYDFQSYYTLHKWDGTQFQLIIKKNPYQLKNVSPYDRESILRDKLFIDCFDDLKNISEHF